MTNPLTQVTYNQEPGYLPIALKPGDNVNMVIAIPLDITNYTFGGSVYDALGNVLFTFDPTITQLTPTGTLTVSLSQAQSSQCVPGTAYDVWWTVSGNKRTFLAGPFQ